MPSTTQLAMGDPQYEHGSPRIHALHLEGGEQRHGEGAHLNEVAGQC